MPYDQSETRPVTQAAYDRLSARAHARPRLAVVGEFSSGKSTLLNLLLGRELLPTRPTATAAPGVWISQGPEAATWVDREGQSHPLESGSIASAPPDAAWIRLQIEAEFLQGCDLIDLSGLADPDRADDMTYQLLSRADCVIWCTPATQAWRQSERAAWISTADWLHGSAILAITRMDKLRNEEDRQKVLARVEHEAAGLFRAFTPISSLLALTALAESDEEAWEASGIDALLNTVNSLLEEVRSRRQSQLSRYVVLPEVPPDAEADEEPAGEAADEGAPPAGPATEEAELALIEQLSTPGPFVLLPSLRSAARASPSLPQPAITEGPEPEAADLAGLRDYFAQEAAPESPEIQAEFQSSDASVAAGHDLPPEAGTAPPEVTEEASEIAETAEGETFDLAAFARRISDQPAPVQLSAPAQDTLQPAEAQAPTAQPAGQDTEDPDPPLSPAARTTRGEDQKGDESGLITAIEAALSRALGSYFTPGAPPASAPPEPAEAADTDLPADPAGSSGQALIWRDIVRRADPETAGHPLVAMIDELLTRLALPPAPGPRL